MSEISANTRSRPNSAELLRFRENTITEVARRHVPRNIVAIFAAQAYSELSFRLRERINFRHRANQKACDAYTFMDSNEFEVINARQQWANWRTIPKAINGQIPDLPLFALDLCCGTGQSTEVLGCYLPLGSKVLGMEFVPSFVEKARAKTYYHLSRQPARVYFRAQSVLDPFLDEQGKLIGDHTVDLVNSSGAVGSHFDRDATRKLAREIERVLKPGGLAAIDSGLPGTRKDQLRRIFEECGLRFSHTAKSCAVDPYTHVCFRKPVN